VPPPPAPPSSPLAAGLDARVRAVATGFLRQRPGIVIPFLAFTVAVLASTGAPRRQVLALASASTLFGAFFLLERRAGRSRVFGELALFRSLAATALGITVGATATGALASPLLPMLSAPIGVGFAAFGRTRRSGLLLGLLIAIALFLFAVSPGVQPLALREGPRRVVLVAAVVDAALLLRVGVASLADAHRRAAESLAAAGDEVVRAALARTRALEMLGSKVAHEVKNPLSAIRAIVEVMLESAAADDRTRKRLTVAAGEIARIGQIVDGYRSMAHPLDSLRRAPADVVRLVEDLAAILEARAARAGVTLLLRAPPSLTFDLDRDRVNESLLNLLLNALEATPAGGTVTLGCELAAGGAELVLGVTDTGRGMDAATLREVGTPFFTGRDGGTGLGVAHARRIAELHGGTLSYESAPGAGTTATIRIPGRARLNGEDATHRPRV
jgi:signal transduction histidine kinase